MKEDPVREERITYEAIVDCYNESEIAMGWYYYLQDRMSFPFSAKVKKNRAVSPKSKGELVRVIGQDPEENCESDMSVQIEYHDLTISIPLYDLVPEGEVDSDTQEAILDWHYWLDRGHSIW